MVTTILYLDFGCQNPQHHSRLFNTFGQLLEETEGNQLQIKNIADGIYYLSTQTKDENLVQKIIIQH
jgi:hypothetical protein